MLRASTHLHNGESAGMVTSLDLAAAARAAGLTPISAIVRELDGAGSAAILPDLPLYPASMIKTPLAMAVYAEVERGAVGIDDRFEVTEANMTANDKPSPLVPGYRATVRELIELMITISDNVATNMFFDIVGRERATAIARETFGLGNTAFHRKLSGSEPLIHDPGWTSGVRNTHPASDAARAFALIRSGTVPFAGDLLATLGRQQFDDKLDAGLRPGDRFFHKTGDTDEVSHDGGILETAEGRTYAIVAYTGLPSGESSSAKFGPFMARLREAL